MHALALLCLFSIARAEEPGDASADATAGGGVLAVAEGPAPLPVGPEAWADLPAEPEALRAAVNAVFLANGNLEPEAATEAMLWRIDFERGLSPQRGEVVVGDGVARLDLGEGFYFLPGSQASDVIEAWGNPRPSHTPLGMIVPSDVSPLDGAWSVVVDFSSDGYVDDADAATIDYDALLAEMQEATESSNEGRVSAGYDALHLAGWAEPPRYDAAEKKLYWAKHLSSTSGDSLNYDIRALGRRGVLELSAVAGMSDLQAVRAGMQGLLPRVHFNEGHRYADFDPSVDKVAAFGIGALIAGKMVAKAGLFKGLIALLFASKKLLLGGGVALLAGAKAIFGRGKQDQG